MFYELLQSSPRTKLMSFIYFLINLNYSFSLGLDVGCLVRRLSGNFFNREDHLLQIEY